MAEYGKKLHFVKGGVTTDISLYTEQSEVGAPALHLLDGGTELFAKLVAPGESNATDLHVDVGGTEYAVAKVAVIHIPPSGTSAGILANAKGFVIGELAGGGDNTHTVYNDILVNIPSPSGSPSSPIGFAIGTESGTEDAYRVDINGNKVV